MLVGWYTVIFIILLFTDLSFIAPHLVHDNDFYHDEGLVASTDHSVEESMTDDGIQTYVEGKEDILRASTDNTYNFYRKK